MLDQKPVEFKVWNPPVLDVDREQCEKQRPAAERGEPLMDYIPLALSVRRPPGHPLFPVEKIQKGYS